MALSSKRSRTDYTVAVICSMDFEMSSFRFMMDKEHDSLGVPPDDENEYLLGEVHGHNVVLACLPGTKGKGAAAILMTNLSRSFPSILWRFLVGIGGGVPSEEHDIRLGDVVVSMPEGDYGGVAQYDLGKATETGFVLKGYLWPSKTLARSVTMRMQSDHEIRPNKIAENVAHMCRRLLEPKKYARPETLDVLHEASSSVLAQQGNSVRTTTPPTEITRTPRASSDPKIHYGLIASGDTVVQSAAERRRLNERLGGHVLCFEMEAAGLLTENSCMVIRGISDYADAYKNNTWRFYAAATASACAIEIISYIRSQDLPERLETEHRAQNKGSTGDSFEGHGVQNTGSGTVTAGRDLNIS